MDGWEMKEVQDVETGQIKREDTLIGGMEVSHMNEEKYLGQIISSNGTNTKNIENHANKCIGLVNKKKQTTPINTSGGK